jgi:signal transduction histidine kinase
VKLTPFRSLAKAQHVATLARVGSHHEPDSREGLALLGEIAAEVAHELRNVLQVIGTSAFVARRELGQGNAPAALPYVGKIERSARLGHAIVDDLMALARGETLRCEPALLTEILEAARTDLGQGARFIDQIDPIDLQVRVHGVLFGRLLHALYENAVQASRPRVPSITTRARTEGGRVLLDVTDDGPGVPAEIASRVFEPLATARPGGTGLGLALAQRIAQAHEGSIALVESPGGTSFRIELLASG